MKKLISYILVSAVAASAGAAASYFLTKKYYLKQTEEEIAEIRKVYEEHRTKVIERLESEYLGNKKLVEMVEEVKSTTSDDEGINYSTKKDLNVIEYFKMYNGLANCENAGDKKVFYETNEKPDLRSGSINPSEPLKKPENTEVNSDIIQYITEEEFNSLPEDYAREYMTYYSNGVLLDEAEEENHDLYGTVGEEFAKNFYKGYCFAKNNATMVAYQIDYFDMPYEYGY